MRGLEDKTNIVTYATLVKSNYTGNISIVFSGLLAQFAALGTDFYLEIVNNTTQVAIEPTLEILHPVTSNVTTVGELLREIYGEPFDSLLHITKEQFYDLTT